MADRARGPDDRLERTLRAKGMRLVAGIDEAGRGPWAGPVVAAAVILDPAAIPDGLDDSKALTAARREQLYAEIMAAATVGVGIAGVDRIDRDNILTATLWAMAEATRQLGAPIELALVDGNRAPALGCPVQTIVAGDAKVASIAAASIIAKVTRDRIMVELHLVHPAFGFAQNKGYGTPGHQRVLAQLGPCAAHRRSFKPVAAALARAAST